MTYFFSDMKYWERVARLNEIRGRVEDAQARLHAATVEMFEAHREHTDLTSRELSSERCNRRFRAPQSVELDFMHFGTEGRES